MKIEKLQLSELTLDPENAKEHPESQVKQIAESIKRFGYCDPIGVSGPENLIVEEHPTMKPIRLLAKLIANSTKPGDTVLDAFGGSGSTLIACEQIGRVCKIVELDEKYASVIVDRWERFTGGKAVRLD